MNLPVFSEEFQITPCKEQAAGGNNLRPLFTTRNLDYFFSFFEFLPTPNNNVEISEGNTRVYEEYE